VTDEERRFTAVREGGGGVAARFCQASRAHYAARLFVTVHAGGFAPASAVSSLSRPLLPALSSSASLFFLQSFCAKTGRTRRGRGQQSEG